MACATSPPPAAAPPLQGRQLGRLPLRGKPAKRRQRRKKRAGFEEAARLAGSPGTGNRFAATVRLSAKLTERCSGSNKKKKPLCHRREAFLIAFPKYPAGESRPASRFPWHTTLSALSRWDRRSRRQVQCLNGLPYIGSVFADSPACTAATASSPCRTALQWKSSDSAGLPATAPPAAHREWHIPA